MITRIDIFSKNYLHLRLFIAVLLMIATLPFVTSISDAASTGSSVTVRLQVVDSLAVSLNGEPSRPDRVIQIGSPESGNVAYIVLDD